MIEKIAKITPHPIVQVCWVVDDMEAAARQWVNLVGAGPFFLLPHIQLDELTYRGKPASLDQSSAVGQWGTVQVELFQQHCQNPSGAREMFAPGQTGVQHLTWFAHDLDAETRRLNEMGFDTVMTCRLPAIGGMRLAWYDTRKVVGAMVEVYEDCELMHKFYRRVAKAAEGWSGEHPIRSL
jgi:glyoxalase/bleomycin resistance protein/dioxygenase superfamily protein